MELAELSEIYSDHWINSNLTLNDFIIIKPSSYHLAELYKIIPNTLITLLNSHNAFIAGGTITSIFSKRPTNDIDIYFPSAKNFSKFHPDLSKLFAEYGFTYSTISTNNSISFLINNKDALKYNFGRCGLVQLINNPKFFGSIFTVLSKFDFTVSMGALGYLKDKLYFIVHRDFLEHLAQRRLIFNADAENSLHSLFRVNKFLQRGYTIDNHELLKLGLKIVNLKIDNYATLREQLAGISQSELTDIVAKFGDKQNEPLVIEEFLKVISHKEKPKEFRKLVME